MSFNCKHFIVMLLAQWSGLPGCPTAVSLSYDWSEHTLCCRDGPAAADADRSAAHSLQQRSQLSAVQPLFIINQLSLSLKGELMIHQAPSSHQRPICLIEQNLFLHVAGIKRRLGLKWVSTILPARPHLISFVFLTPLGLERNLFSFTKPGQHRSTGAVKHTTSSAKSGSRRSVHPYEANLLPVSLILQNVRVNLDVSSKQTGLHFSVTVTIIIFITSQAFVPKVLKFFILTLILFRILIEITFKHIWKCVIPSQKKKKKFTEHFFNFKEPEVDQQSRQFSCWLRTTENQTELMSKPSKLLRPWINLTIIFSERINAAEEWAANHEKKEEERGKKKRHTLTQQPRIKLNSINSMCRDSPSLTDNLYSFTSTHFSLSYSSNRSSRCQNNVAYLIKKVRINLKNATLHTNSEFRVESGFCPLNSSNSYL